MSFIELAKKRYSERAFSEQQVEQEKLALILEAARMAPTASNMQPQRILVVRGAEGMEKLQRAANVHGAPTALIVSGDTHHVWVRPFDDKSMIDTDTAIVATHMMLEAADIDVASCWITYFIPYVLKKLFRIPAYYEPVGIMALGYPARKHTAPQSHSGNRLQLKDMVKYGSY